MIERNAASELTAARLVSQLRACEVASLAFCRLLERWGRGDAVPATPGGRQAALRRAADRVETAIAGLEQPLSQYLLELEPERAEGRSWYGGPGSRGARRVASRARPGGCARVPEPRGRGLPRARRARPRARRARQRRRVSTPRPTARLCGQVCSTSGTRSSDPRSTTCARSLRRPRIAVVGSLNLDLVTRCERLRGQVRRSPAVVARFAGRERRQPGRRLRSQRAELTKIGAIGTSTSGEALRGLPRGRREGRSR